MLVGQNYKRSIILVADRLILMATFGRRFVTDTTEGFEPTLHDEGYYIILQYLDSN